MKVGMIFGEGVSGRGAREVLKKMKYEIIMVDDKTGMPSDSAEELMDKVDIFIKSPGIPYTHLVKKAFEMKVEVVDEIELAYRYMKKAGIKTKIIAVTGSNGKTTVTSKITELLQKAGYKCEHAGNIGNSFGELICEREDLDYVVLELSSFQLENLKEFKADIAMVINLSPDHLSRYKSEQEYFDAKFNIGKNQTNEDIFIYNLNDKDSMKRIEKITGHKLGVTVGAGKEYAVCHITDAYVVYNGKVILEKEKLSLRGKHNLENVLFILTVAECIGIDENIVREFLYSTKPLEHRMEKFYKWKNIYFVNDSKGTNIDSTCFAIDAYEDAVLICGGKEKGLPLDELVEKIREKISEVYLIGEMTERFKEALLLGGYPNKKIHTAGDMENAVKILREKLSGDEEKVVLLSPSTSSFDQFPNFETRGRVFKDLVRKYFKEGEEL